MDKIQSKEERKRIKDLVEQLLFDRDECRTMFWDAVNMADANLSDATGRIDKLILRVLMAETPEEAEKIARDEV